jgi:hypothetical protein
MRVGPMPLNLDHAGRVRGPLGRGALPSASSSLTDTTDRYPQKTFRSGSPGEPWSVHSSD